MAYNKATDSGMPGRCWCRCDDCGERFMLPRHAFSNRTRPRCPACGSTWIEPSARAKGDMVDAEDCFGDDQRKLARPTDAHD